MYVKRHRFASVICSRYQIIKQTLQVFVYEFCDKFHTPYFYVFRNGGASKKFFLNRRKNICGALRCDRLSDLQTAEAFQTSLLVSHCQTHCRNSDVRRA